jgi:hypothetical protein
MPHTQSKKKTWLILGIASLLLAFVGYNMRDIIFGCPLIIHGATDGATVTSLIFPIAGNARHAKTITIDGRTVAFDRNGNFTEKILLSPGYNIVEVALTDRFGKEKTRTFHLYADPTVAVATASGPQTN